MEALPVCIAVLGLADTEEARELSGRGRGLCQSRDSFVGKHTPGQTGPLRPAARIEFAVLEAA